MTRAPLPALRGLFAAGGAPSASHAVLAHVPASDRLLEPMARARIAQGGGASLDALARPLDVGTVLSRVTDAAAAAQAPSIEEEGRRLAARREKGAKKPVVAETSGAVVSETRADLPRRAIAKPTVDAAAVRAAVARAFDAPALARARMANATIASEAREPRFVRRDAPLSPRVSMSPPAEEAPRAAHSAAAQSGADTPVVLERTVTEIERLLAVAAPSVGRLAAPEASRRPTATPAERAPASKDVSRLLASAVDRASTATASATPTPTPASVAARPVVASSLDAPHRATTQTSAPDIEPSGGGFRGLAQRTLVPATSGGSTPVRRIEPERRMPMDLSFDTLDNRVADSLARILEREARRHGIDLSEARA